MIGKAEILEELSGLVGEVFGPDDAPTLGRFQAAFQRAGLDPVELPQVGSEYTVMLGLGMYEALRSRGARPGDAVFMAIGSAFTDGLAVGLRLGAKLNGGDAR